jgi:hypothetical protein
MRNRYFCAYPRCRNRPARIVVIDPIFPASGRVGPSRGPVVRETGAVPAKPPEPEQERQALVCTKTPRKKSSEQHGSESSGPQSEGCSILDERIPGLLFESLASVQAAAVSASQGIPYRALRRAMALESNEKSELTHAAQAVAAKHPAFFSQHKDALEFVAVLMAINAAQMEHLLSLMDQFDGSPAPSAPGPMGNHICSVREALGIALIVLAPLGLLALVLLVQHLRRN